MTVQVAETQESTNLDNEHGRPASCEKVSEPGQPRGDTVETCGYGPTETPVDPAKVLTRQSLFRQRAIFLGTIVLLNLVIAMVALFGKRSKLNLALIFFIKSKDFLSALITPFGLLFGKIRRVARPLQAVPRLWILSLIPAYSESEEQIIKTIFSLRDNDVEPHKQVMLVILDGKPRDIAGQMTRVDRMIERPYVSLKFKIGTLRIASGFMQDVPVIVIEKLKNSGKKDSLILCHDLFNYPRENLHEWTKLLRDEMWTTILPPLTGTDDFQAFDLIFCTDADSTIHKGAVASLANAIARNSSAIAACGLVLVELEPGFEWSAWNLYQQFQYTFGQYVRRRAEGFLGKVTCLPGCITMVAVRPEMAGAMRRYAEPVRGSLVLSHQVQYLGTDRRLTYSMLSQGKHLQTLFVPAAVSETVAPQSLQHYLSQRRRWGSNAYFNNYFYLAGEKMIVMTRIAAAVEIIRLSFVFYRIMNTGLFIHRLTGGIDVVALAPMLVISQLPSLWFVCSVLLEAPLRSRAHKLLLGFCINKFISPFMSATIFTKVALNLGSQAWGMSGVTASSSAAAPPVQDSAPPASGDCSNAHFVEAAGASVDRAGGQPGGLLRRRTEDDLSLAERGEVL